MRPRAFTLVEVMVSIAIALLLILGINQVFRATAQVTGGGQAMTTCSQYARTVKSAITADLRNGAWQDAPVLIIRGEQRYAFRSANDQQGAADPANPANDPLFPGQTVPAYFVNGRSHRIDRLGFFARGDFQRQTAPGAPSPAYTVFVTAPEAWIWYGHLALPNNATMSPNNKFPSGWISNAQFFGPGDTNAANDNDNFAVDWTLGRMAILLAGLGVNSQNPNAHDALIAGTQVTAPVFLQPLTFDTLSANGNDSAVMSLHDIAATDIPDYITSLYQIVTAPPPGPNSAQLNWFYWLLGCQYQGGIFVSDHRFWAAPFVPDNKMPGSSQSNLDSALTSIGVNGRINSYSLAWNAPVIARGCTSFIVEFAGNYMTQTDNPGNDPLLKPDGTVIAGTPDPNPDHIDFISVRNPNGTFSRQIRWYGFPRLTAPRTGKGTIQSSGGSISQMQIDDVLPLRDVLSYYGFTPANPIPFEHFPTGFPPAGGTGTVPNYTLLASGSSKDLSYTCAWGPYPAGSDLSYGLPKLLRITVFFDDPNGRLTDAQAYEYVIDLRQ